MGNSLIQEPVIHDALLTIGLIREQQSGEDLCRLIHSPFLVNEEDNGLTRAELERVIRKRLTNLCRVSDFLYFTGETQKDHYCPKFYRALGKVRELHRRHPKTDFLGQLDAVVCGHPTNLWLARHNSDPASAACAEAMAECFGAIRPPVRSDRATRSKYGFEPFTPAVSLEPNSATFFPR